MRVALVGPVYPYRGGIAHYTTMLHGALCAAGHEVLLVSFRRQYPRWLFPGRSDRDPSRQAFESGEAQYWLDPLNPLTWLATFWRIRRFGPAVVVLQWWTAFWAPVWWTLAALQKLFTRSRLVFICHNVRPHEPRPWDTWLARAVLGWGDRFVVQARSEAQELAAILPGRPVTVAPHPVNNLFERAGASRGAARAALGLPAAAPVLLFFGFVREYKGLQHLIEAMPRVRAALGDARLLIVGEFWQDKAPYLAQIERLGLGACVMVVDRYVPNEDVPAYFAAADLVALPYLHATQSAVVQVAFGFGLPVVTTRVGGLPDVVVEGENGALAQPGDASAFAEAVIRCWHRLCGDAGRERLPAANGAGWERLARAVTAGGMERE